MARISKDPDVRRDEIIASANKLFFSKGYEKTSITDIVSQIGVAKGLFYYYFDSKYALLDALVEDLAIQATAQMQTVVEDETLSALEKWRQAHSVASAWKLQRKDELMPLMKIVMSEDNLRLRVNLERRSMVLISAEYAKIIEQGIAEGVFATAYPADSAEIVVSIFNSVRDLFYDVMFQHEKYDNPHQFVSRKLHALQEAIERVLGAEPGTLPLLDSYDSMLDDWFPTNQ